MSVLIPLAIAGAGLGVGIALWKLGEIQKVKAFMEQRKKEIEEEYKVDMFRQMKEGLVGFGAMLSSGLTGMGQQLGAGLGAGLGGFGEKLSAGMKAMGKGISSGIGQLGAGLSKGLANFGLQLSSGLSAGISSLGTSLRTGISSIGTGLQTGISSLGEKAKETVEGLGEKAKELGEGALDKASKFMSPIYSIMEGLKAFGRGAYQIGKTGYQVLWKTPYDVGYKIGSFFFGEPSKKRFKAWLETQKTLIDRMKSFARDLPLYKFMELAKRTTVPAEFKERFLEYAKGFWKWRREPSFKSQFALKGGVLYSTMKKYYFG